MTRDDRGGRDTPDERFERTLLESARGDELPEGEAAAAWMRFSTAATTFATAIAAGAAAHEGPPPGLPPAGWGPALRWMAVGAIGGALGGAALTGLWLRRGPSASQPTQTTIAGPPGAPIPHRRPPIEPPAPVAEEVPPAQGPSALAAEVRAIDAARAALTRGASDETLARIARYLRAFPRGELRADAEVVALEALAAKRDRPTLERRAARFLHRHPNDPHAARVRRLLEE